MVPKYNFVRHFNEESSVTEVFSSILDCSITTSLKSQDYQIDNQRCNRKEIGIQSENQLGKTESTIDIKLAATIEHP